MGKQTGIQYAHSSCNPSDGCEGCELWNAKRRVCYAGYAHERYRGATAGFSVVSRHPKRMAEASKWGPPTDREHNAKPHLRHIGRRLIFLFDMSDGFSLSDFNGDVEALFRWLYVVVIKAATDAKGGRHIWLLFTKRPSLMLRFSKWLRKETSLKQWPENIVPFTSVTGKATLKRLDPLCEIESRYRGVSFEPLWEDVGDISKWIDRLSWVVAGGQSESYDLLNAESLARGERFIRPSHPAWFLSLRDQCKGAKVPVPFFFKQWGAFIPADAHGADRHKRKTLWIANDGEIVPRLHPDGHFDRAKDWTFMTAVGKNNAHRNIDGVEYNETPTFKNEQAALFDGCNQRSKPVGRRNTPWS